MGKFFTTTSRVFTPSESYIRKLMAIRQKAIKAGKMLPTRYDASYPEKALMYKGRGLK